VIAVSAARPATASSSPTTPSTAPTRATHCYTPRPSGAPSPPPWTRSPARPGTAVRIFANVERKDDPRYPDRDPAYFVNRFRRHFAAHLWPGKRLPDLYYDPRSLDPYPTQRAILYAKCVIVDDAQVFLTSANCTQAGQQRNLEAGLLLQDPALARDLAAQFDALAQAAALLQIHGRDAHH